jgi:hypothetical protein
MPGTRSGSLPVSMTAVIFSDGEPPTALKPPEDRPIRHWHPPFIPNAPALPVPCELQTPGCPQPSSPPIWPWLLGGAALIGAGYRVVVALAKPRYGRPITPDEGLRIVTIAKQLAEGAYKNAQNKWGTRIDLTGGKYSDCSNFVHDVLVKSGFRLDWTQWGHGDTVNLSPQAFERVIGDPRPEDIVVQSQGTFKHMGVIAEKVKDGIYRAYQIGNSDLTRTFEPGHLVSWGPPNSHTIFNKGSLEFYRAKVQLAEKAAQSAT